MRVSAGALLASGLSAAIFGLWRFAAAFDGKAGMRDWLWLAFESAVMLWTFPLYALAFCGLGALVVYKGTGRRLFSAIGAGLIAVLYGGFLLAFGMIDAGGASVMNTLPATLVALALSGLIGGYYGHVGWFPPTSSDAA